MIKPSFLFPRPFRYPGFVLFAAGVLLGISRFYFGLKPNFFDMKVFAVFSSYLGNKFMTVIKNNMCEEFALLFLVLGLFLMAFSKERIETENTNKLRLRAFFISAYGSLIFLLFSIFFTFGFAFVYMMILNSVLSLALYLLAFKILLAKENRIKHI